MGSSEETRPADSHAGKEFCTRLQSVDEHGRVNAWPHVKRLGEILRNEPVSQITVELTHRE